MLQVGYVVILVKVVTQVNKVFPVVMVLLYLQVHAVNHGLIGLLVSTVTLVSYVLKVNLARGMRHYMRLVRWNFLIRNRIQRKIMILG